MKIGLIDPGSKKLLINEQFPHIGLAYVGAILEERGHDVRILDVGLAGSEKTESFLQDGFDLIGLSVTSFTHQNSLGIAKKIKDINNNTIVVLGGPHVPIGMGSTLDSPHVDCAIYGEGEYTMRELADVLQRNLKPVTRDLSAIPGLIFRDEDRVVVSPPRARIDNLDGLPHPAFHLFPMDKYGLYPVLTSRGCPFGCSFCSIKAIWGTLWKYRSPEYIVREIEIAIKKFNWEKKPFNIIDDSFNVDPDRVMAFCQLLLERNLNIKWFSSGFRADRVSLALALKMKESGCMGVSVGIESASNEVLKKIKKKETLEDITRGCQNLSRAGVPVQAQFMIGNPGETFETVRESIEYAKKQRFSNVAFYLALPYPKTELWDYVKENGRFLKDDYTQFHHFSGEPVFETPEFSAEERARAYALGRRLALKSKIRVELMKKLSRIRRLDFEDIGHRRVMKAGTRIFKYVLDLSLRRDEKV